MNISLENIDKVSAVLTIKMEKADYADRVEGFEGFPQKSKHAGFPSGNGAHEHHQQDIPQEHDSGNGLQDGIRRGFRISRQGEDRLRG